MRKWGMKLSIIIPVYNERRSIATVLKEVKSVGLPYGLDKEIIMVDDGSVDGTRKELERYGADAEIKIMYREKNEGKSSAVKAGIAMSTGAILLIQDADLEYSPRDYPRLLDPIVKDGMPVVYGSRLKGRNTTMPLVNRLANIASTITINLLYGARLSDVHTCFKVFRREVLSGIELTPRHFVFDIEVTAALLKRGYTICEVPIRYVARTKREGKKITWLQAMELYWDIIKYRFRRNEPY